MCVCPLRRNTDCCWMSLSGWSRLAFRQTLLCTPHTLGPKKCISVGKYSKIQLVQKYRRTLVRTHRTPKKCVSDGWIFQVGKPNTSKVIPQMTCSLNHSTRKRDTFSENSNIFLWWQLKALFAFSIPLKSSKKLFNLSRAPNVFFH